MLAQKMSLDFEEEVVLRLIGYHVRGPSIPVRLPSFILPFYAPEADSCGFMWIQLRREVSCEKFDDATILFLFEGRAKHLPVLCEIRSFVMGASRLVLASDYRDFFRYELFRRGSSEIPVVGGAIPNRGDISLDCVWIFVVAECAVDGFFPGVCQCPDVVKCV